MTLREWLRAKLWPERPDVRAFRHAVDLWVWGPIPKRALRLPADDARAISPFAISGGYRVAGWLDLAWATQDDHKEGQR